MNVTSLLNTKQSEIYTIIYRFSPKNALVEIRPSNMNFFSKIGQYKLATETTSEQQESSKAS